MSKKNNPAMDADMEQIAELGEAIDPMDTNVNFTSNTLDESEENADAPAADEAKEKSEESDDDTEETTDDEEALDEEPAEESDDETDPQTPEEKPRNLDKARRRITKQKSKVDELREHTDAKFDKMMDAIHTLADNVAKAKTPEKVEEAEDEIVTYAKKHGIENVDEVRELVELAERRAEKNVLSKMPKTEPTVEKKESVIEETTPDDPTTHASFETEWQPFEDSFLEKHPDATAKQIKQLKKDMYAVAHTTEYADAPLSTIYEKDADLQDIFFTPKNKSAETGIRISATSPKPNQVVDDLDADINSIDDAMAAQESLNNLTQEKEINVRRNGKTIRMRG